MTAKKVPCKICGAEILPSTAQRTNGLCMPCENGSKTAPEDFMLVRSRWIRQIRADADDTPIGDFKKRYLAGDRESVWRELHRLDLRQPTPQPAFQDIVECVRETMRRVRINIERLHAGLKGIGYEFWSPNSAHVPPAVADMEKLESIEAMCGPLPITLRMFYEEVGSVDFRQSPNQLIQWGDAKRRTSSPLRLLGEEDPLVVYSVSMVAREMKQNLKRLMRRFLDEPGWRRLPISLAPDEFHKANYSGGIDYHMLVPETAVDFPLVGFWLDADDESEARNENLYPFSEDFGPSGLFISYLRRCMAGGGFLGKSDIDGVRPRQPPQWEPIHAVARELLSI